MEDFYYAGGLRALMNAAAAIACISMRAPSPVHDARRRTSKARQVHDDDVIRTLDDAVYHEGSLAVLRGNLAPDGCVIKPAACAPRLREHDRSGARVRQLPGPQGGVGGRLAGRDPRSCACAARRGPAGRTRDAGVGNAADPPGRC